MSNRLDRRDIDRLCCLHFPNGIRIFRGRDLHSRPQLCISVMIYSTPLSTHHRELQVAVLVSVSLEVLFPFSPLFSYHPNLTICVSADCHTSSFSISLKICHIQCANIDACWERIVFCSGHPSHRCFLYPSDSNSRFYYLIRLTSTTYPGAAVSGLIFVDVAPSERTEVALLDWIPFDSRRSIDT